MPTDLPVLYVKPHCPWCQEVSAFMEEHGIGHRRVDVTADHEGYEEMRRISGQSKAPTLDWHGTILADFGTEELIPFLRDKNVKLEDS